MNWLLILFLSLIVLHFLAEYALAYLNESHTQAHRNNLPNALKAVMDEATYQKSIDYTLAKSRFGRITETCETLFTLAMLATGAVPFLLKYLSEWLGHSLLSYALMVMVIQIAFNVPFLPFQWIQQFKIEAAYNFNRSTQSLWWGDRIKGLLLMLIIGTPLLMGIMAFYNHFQTSWWFMAAGALVIFQITFMLLYPRLILPLFNKLSPLPEGPLKDRLMHLADTAGFQAKTIEIMDGSKRSSHSNAFFTGFGRFRRIVFYDTLIEQLTPEQIEAVLAHEIGHYKKGHVIKHLILSTLFTLIGFYLMDYTLKSPTFFSAFGFDANDQRLWLTGLMIIGSWLISPLTFCIQPCMTYLSRRHEYEADAFAKAAVKSPEPLIEALHQLSRKNLSNLVPHPLYSGIYYSHPTLIERETVLRQTSLH